LPEAERLALRRVKQGGSTSALTRMRSFAGWQGGASVAPTIEYQQMVITDMVKRVMR
jgi:hypothetical protein